MRRAVVRPGLWRLIHPLQVPDEGFSGQVQTQSCTQLDHTDCADNQQHNEGDDGAHGRYFGAFVYRTSG